MRTLTNALCALTLLLAPATLLAAPTPQDKEAARGFADKGSELFEAGKYEEAISLFRKADERVHAPTFVLVIAQAHVKLGKLVEARSLYQQVIDDKLPTPTPASFVEAQTTAKRELDDLVRRIPTLQVVVTGAPASEVKVTLDGAPVEAIEQPLAQNPGEHTVVVTGPSGASVTRSVTLREGGTERVEIALASADLQTPPSDGATGSKGSLVPAIAAFGVGVVGLGLGAVTGAMALGQVSDIKKSCSANVCPKALEADADSVGTLADVSTAGFILGGAGVAAGVALFFIRPGGGSSSAQETSRVRASFGLGSVHVSGTF